MGSERPQDLVGLAHPRLEFGGKNFRLHQVGHPQPGPRRFVAVRGADAALGRAELLLALGEFAAFVETRVVRHYQMRAIADEQVFLDGDAERAQAVDLLDERNRIDDDAVADHADLAGPQDARGDEVQHVLLPAEDDGMAGVVAPLTAHDDVGAAREHVDDLALAFVTPLRAYENDVRHTWKGYAGRKNGMRKRLPRSI